MTVSSRYDDKVDTLMTATVSLPPGLRIGKRGEGLETTSSRAGELRLMVTHQHLEVVRGVLKKGELMFLVPPEDIEPTVEMCYVLEGYFQYKEAGSAVTIGPGDYVVAEALEGPVNLSALSEVSFLYLTPRPFFHEISETLKELMRLAVDVEAKDGYTADHCLRIQRLSYATGQELGLAAHRLYLLNYGAYLHDLGKVRIPLEILQKPAALTSDEWRVMKCHPTFGRELLASTFMKDVGPIVEQHHERYDGSGYPHGLAGDEILREAAIVAVADTYDAMTTDRVYRKALHPEVALAEIDKYAGVHYPREVVTAFFSALRRLELYADKQQ